MKASDARKRTEDGLAKRKETEVAADQLRLRGLEESRKKAREEFDEHYEMLMKGVCQVADGGKNSTTRVYTALLNNDGSHGKRHAYENELARLAIRRLKIDGYVVNQTTRMELVKDQDGREHQAVCIEVEISW